MPADSADAHAARIAAALAADGWCVVDDWLPDAAWRALADACRRHAAAGALAPAAIGRGAARHHDPAVRGDHTRWLQADDPADAPALHALDALRAGLNHELFLGLRRTEAHYARYPPGAGYARHRDRFRDDDARVVSLVLYLNEAWSDADGGALRIFAPDGDTPHDVLPIGGRLAVFRAADVEHEVRAARRERLSIAAWLRRD
ncbi:MAG: 2OG-Fe(II) oxygenase [Xanthomonadaceae bacterium]|jgi:SM-20-related protein|nr:2OG-Fe(II) oxygenase [Xanthomonadaceae bacterium]